MTNSDFQAWLEVSKAEVWADWLDYVDGMGITELWETTGLTKQDATTIGNAGEAFQDFARQSYDDSRDFSNSGI